MCHYPETIKLLYVVKEVNPETKELETKLITHKFSSLKLIPPDEVTIDKIRNHLLSSMEKFKDEFLSCADEREKEITRLEQEVLSKDDHLVSYGNKALFIEANRGKVGRVKTYLSQFDVNSSIENGTTPLFIASYDGHLAVVETLLAKGGNPNLYREDRASCLFSASQNGHIGVVKLLLNAGADPNLSRSNGATPIVVAIFNNHIEIIKTLLPKIDLDICKWRGTSIKKLIKNRIKNKEEREELLEILYLQTTPSSFIRNKSNPPALRKNERHCTIL